MQFLYLLNSIVYLQFFSMELALCRKTVNFFENLRHLLYSFSQATGKVSSIKVKLTTSDLEKAFPISNIPLEKAFPIFSVLHLQLETSSAKKSECEDTNCFCRFRKSFFSKTTGHISSINMFQMKISYKIVLFIL